MTKYNIGDLLIIPSVEKIGLIIDAQKTKYHNKYSIFWQYKAGDTDTVWVSESTITLWLSKVEGRGKNNLNEYYPVK